MPHAKPHPPFGSPSALPKKQPRFYPPPPAPAGDLVLKLADIDSKVAKQVSDAGTLVFHCVGDTGNDGGHDTQEAIARAMEKQRKEADDHLRPGFFYHLGDVVYTLGESRFYDDRFYKPYKRYGAPVVSIPGNHDGYGSQNSPGTTLDGWKDHFLGTLPPAQWFPYREPARLPHVFWALETPMAHFIGLYSNVDGYLDDPASTATPQEDWLVDRLKAAGNNPVLLMVHHPAYSFDDDHHGSPAIEEALDRAAEKAKRWPNAVFSGHVHSYQRFTRTVGSRQIPYVVAGAGGRANSRKELANAMEWQGHPAVKPPFTAIRKGSPIGVELVAADWKDPGYLQVTVTKKKLHCAYIRVPFDEDQQPDWHDAFTLDFASGIITNQ